VDSGCVIPIGPAPETADGAPPTPDGSPPIPKGSWNDITSNLPFNPCGSTSLISVEPDGATLIAGIGVVGLFSNSSQSSTWQELGAKSPKVPIANRPTAIVYDPKSPQTFWESGIYGTEGVYKTTDNGNTFVQLGTVGDQHHCDLVSIDFTDASRATLVAGGHEEAQSLFLSIDGGMTWTNIGANLPTNTFCTLPLVLGPSTFLVGCNYFNTPPNGVYLSTDRGAHWTQQETSGRGGEGAPLLASDGTIYWASPEQGGLIKSKGVNWTSLVGPGVILSMTPIELPNGNLATVANEVGNQYGPLYVMTSADGIHWTPVTAALPTSEITGLAYSPQRNAFYVVNSACPDGGTLGPILEFNITAGDG
jgi:photosystem II stability/assembly factor-like uncharacterized protein